MIDCYCDYFEKYKNLIRWEDPTMTMIFAVFLCIALLVVTFFPIKYLLEISIMYRIYKG